MYEKYMKFVKHSYVCSFCYYNADLGLYSDNRNFAFKLDFGATLSMSKTTN